MNCIACQKNVCQSLQSCLDLLPDPLEILQRYLEKDTHLVDGGLAGNLSRLDELVLFIKDRKYKKVGLTYCSRLEKVAQSVQDFFRLQGIDSRGISCTVRALPQTAVNQDSKIPGVSCNPLTQASQMNAEGFDLALIIGLCLGQDILFTRTFHGDQSTLIGKDRIHCHNPLKAIKNDLS